MEILYTNKAREKLISGIEKVANAVKVTLGPMGRNVTINQEFGAPRVTKDGVTVANSIRLVDEEENAGAQLIKQAASKAAFEAGDGTTTTTILTHEIVKAGNKAVVAGCNPMDIKRGMDLAVKTIVNHLDSKSKKIENIKEITQVATISANNDFEIGKKIAETISLIGKDGVVQVQESNSPVVEVETVQGLSFKNGYLSPYFINNLQKGDVEFDDCLILTHTGKLTNAYDILPILESVYQSGKSFLLIAESFSEEVLAILIQNKMKGALNCVAVKAPSFAPYQKDILSDISVVCDSLLITEDLGLTTKDIKFEMLGFAKKVKVTKDSTIIMNGRGSPEKIELRCEEIRTALKDIKNNEFEKNIAKSRLAKLTSGIGIIRVGANTDVELKEIKDRIDDAVAATFAAMDEGILPGGGIALLNCEETLGLLLGENKDQQVGIEIIKEVLSSPLKQICSNAGEDSFEICFKIREKNDFEIGYDAQNKEIVNMMEKGIIDPTKVVKTAIKDATSIASMIITTEALIPFIKKSSSEQR
jgi:chaperonin GroEL